MIDQSSHDSIPDELDKSIAFGVNELGKFEFGDMYHAAATLLLKPDVEFCFVGTDSEQDAYFEFIQSFGPTNLTRVSVQQYKKDKDKYFRAGMSADVIEKFSLNDDTKKRFLDVSSFDECDDNLREFIESRVRKCDCPVVLIWIRDQEYREDRNSTFESIKRLKNRLQAAGYKTVLIGSELDEFRSETGNFLNFHQEEPFRSSVRCQLRMFWLLQAHYNVVASVGMMSGGMDGPAFFSNLPAIFFCKQEDDGRMSKVCQTFTNMKIIYYELIAEKTEFENHQDSEIEQLIEYLGNTHTM